MPCSSQMARKIEVDEEVDTLSSGSLIDETSTVYKPRRVSQCRGRRYLELW